MNKSVLLFALAVLLGACTTSIEMPENSEGVDEMRISPCACNKLDYEGAKFKWLG